MISNSTHIFRVGLRILTELVNPTNPKSWVRPKIHLNPTLIIYIFFLSSKISEDRKQIF